MLRWMKSPLLVRARQDSLSDFLVAAECAYALLVDVQDAHSPLALGMFAAVADGAELDELEWATELTPHGSLPMHTLAPPEVPNDLAHACFFALHVRTRNRGTFARRVSFGRGGDQDVVLVDSSVSRHHGWFETNSRGRLVIHDGGSSNGIRVNRATVIGERELVGSELIQMGRVRGFALPLDRFWKLARTA